MPHVVNTKELKSIHNNPHGHLIRIIIRIITIVLLAFLYFKTDAHAVVHVILAAIFVITFIEQKKNITINVIVSMYDDRVEIEKKDISDSFGNKTREVYVFDYKTKPVIEYSTKNKAVTIRGNAITEKFKSGTMNSGGLTEKMKSKSENAVFVTFGCDDSIDIVKEFHENTPLKVEIINC